MGGSVCDGGSAFLPVERLVADKAGGASLCQRRQPPKAGAEGQRLQRLVPPATIGPRVGWADHAGLCQRLPTMPRCASSCGREQTATEHRRALVYYFGIQPRVGCRSAKLRVSGAGVACSV